MSQFFSVKTDAFAPEINSSLEGAGSSNIGSGNKGARRRTSWAISLTAVCFLFGGLLAVQLRAIERVRADRQKGVANVVAQQQQNIRMLAQIKQEREQSLASKAQLKVLTARLSHSGSLTKSQLAKLTNQLSELQALSGFSAVSGPGVRMILADNPQALKQGGDSRFLPGIVHDFDLLQIVNELRGAKAEAISIRGSGGITRRITAWTPIRCVGGPILINFEPVTPPYVIEAIGEPKTLEGTLNLPGGIVDNLRNIAGGTGLGVQISLIDDLTLPASETLPRLRNARIARP